MRGIFSAGVLDEFLVNKYDPFDLYMGVSAGAGNLSSHVAGQYQRNYRLYTGFMRTRNFMSMKRFLLGGHYMDLDWLWDICDREDRLNVPAAYENTRHKEFIIVCTSVQTGKPVYIRPTVANWNDALKASSAIPVLFKTKLMIDRQRLVDGGVSDAIPVIEAHRRGANHIVVIRPHPSDYVKKGGMEARISTLFFRKHKGFKKTILEKPATYMESVRFMETPPQGVTVHQIAPAKPLHTSRTSTDLQGLEWDYQLGRELGKDFILRSPP